MISSCSSLLTEHPTRKLFYCTASWPTVSACAWHTYLNHERRIRRLFNHRPGYAGKRNLQSTTPRCVCLSGVGTDVEIDETIIRRTLREGAEKIRLSVFPFPDANRELESQILFRISLLLNRFVIVAVAFLDAEINTAWRTLNDYTKRYLPFHGNAA